MSNDSLLIDTIFSSCRKRSCQFTYKPAKIDIIDLWTLFAEGRHQICSFYQCQFFHLQTDLLAHEISWPRFSYVRTHHMFSQILNLLFGVIGFFWAKDCLNDKTYSNIKVSWFQKDFLVSSILSNNERKKSTLLLWYLRSTCFRLFFGRIWRHQKDILKLTEIYVWQKYLFWGALCYTSAYNVDRN
jgi:hypothetical protein